MNSILLVHLGEYVPPYLRDCVHQIRLWNPPEDLDIFIVLEPCHSGKDFWIELIAKYNVRLVYTNELEPTAEHTAFLKGYVGDTDFRKGYWRHVKERFFYMEEVIRTFGLGPIVAMEYDILLYAHVKELLVRLLEHSPRQLAMVMDNEERGHPGFLFIPSAAAIQRFNAFIVEMICSNLEDMKLLAEFRKTNCESGVKCLPIITSRRNKTIPTRFARNGLSCANPEFLSEGFETIGFLFDSLCVGQMIGGIDPRNVGGKYTIGYENESALYSVREMDLTWKKEGGLWRPILDNVPLATIHMHSKGLQYFLSDRDEVKMTEIGLEIVSKGLQPN